MLLLQINMSYFLASIAFLSTRNIHNRIVLVSSTIKHDGINIEDDYPPNGFQDAMIHIENNVTYSNDPIIYEHSQSYFSSKLDSAEKSNLSLHPDVIVFASYKKEVKEVIEFYKECGYKISIYSGGNQYAGYSSCQESIMNPCMQLGVSSIDNFVHNEENGQITLGVVLTMGEVHAKTVPLGITILMGIYKYVGVGGNF